MCVRKDLDVTIYHGALKSRWRIHMPYGRWRGICRKRMCPAIRTMRLWRTGLSAQRRGDSHLPS